MLKKEQIKENRLKWAKFLQNPTLEKHLGELEDPLNPNARCCLGHGCACFEISKESRQDCGVVVLYDGCYDYAPPSFVNLVGLTTKSGQFLDGKVMDKACLADLNDHTYTSPQEIGKMMENWIEGGVGTPFLPLSEFPE